MRRRSWVQALGAAILLFVLAMVACAAHAWHAPRGPVLAALWALGVVLGAVVSWARALGPLRTESNVVHTRPREWARLIGATVAGGLTAAGGAVAVAMAISDMRSLVFASALGSLWMATYPLHPLVFQLLLERDLAQGADGIRLGRKFVAFRAMRRVTQEGRALVVDLVGGGRHAITLAGEAVAAELATRIRERMGSSENASRVARGGRAFAVWKRELVSADYRSSQLTTDEAAKIVSSGAASPDERVGAALVLAGSGDRERIRIAASECVEPRVRVALERVIDETLDEETMAELERSSG